MDPIDAPDWQTICPDIPSREVQALISAILAEVFEVAAGEPLYVQRRRDGACVIVPSFRANAPRQRNLITFFPANGALKVDIRPSALPNRTAVTAENLGEIADRLRERWALLLAAD